jgi:uncharacterized membrane protein YkoI
MSHGGKRGQIVVALIALGAGTAALAGSDEGIDRKLAAVQGARVPLAEAISVAERQAGGRAAKVDLERQGSGYVYEVEILSTNGAANVFVDPSTGSVLRTDRGGEHGKSSSSEDGTTLSELTASRTTLAQAIAAAEGGTQGKAIAASAGDEDDGGGRGRLLTVDVAGQNGVQRVVVDRSTGNVVKIAADDPEHEDGDHGDQGDEETED